MHRRPGPTAPTGALLSSLRHLPSRPCRTSTDVLCLSFSLQGHPRIKKRSRVTGTKKAELSYLTMCQQHCLPAPKEARALASSWMPRRMSDADSPRPTALGLPLPCCHSVYSLISKQPTSQLLPFSNPSTEGTNTKSLK